MGLSKVAAVGPAEGDGNAADRRGGPVTQREILSGARRADRSAGKR